METHRDLEECYFRGKVNWNGLRGFFDELDDDMKYLILEFSSPPPPGGDGRMDLTGIARRLRSYVPEADDDFYDALVNDRRMPASPVTWHGSKCDCARLLRHFGFTDKEANRIFCCMHRGRRLARIKISSDMGRKGDSSYPVMAVLKDYPYKPL